MFGKKEIDIDELWSLAQSAYFHVVKELTKYIEAGQTIRDIPPYLIETINVLAKHHPAVSGDIDRLLNKLGCDLDYCKKIYKQTKH